MQEKLAIELKCMKERDSFIKTDGLDNLNRWVLDWKSRERMLALSQLTIETEELIAQIREKRYETINWSL